MKKITLIILLVVGICQLTYAQHESSLYFMQSIHQSNYLNPALAPKYRFSLGLPGMSSVYFGFANTGFKYNDFITKTADDSLAVDLSKFASGLKKKNYFLMSGQVDLFSFSMRINPRMHFMFNSSVKSYSRMMYPKGTLAIFIDGNEGYLNEAMQISPAAESVTYLENAAGFSYVVNKDLTVGVRLKFLRGGANVRTEKADFSIYTDEENYNITISGDGLIKTAGLDAADDLDLDSPDEILDFLANKGFAIDFGATYNVTDRLTVGLSLLDIGGIKWKEDLQGYELDPAFSSYTFKGVNLQNVMNDDKKMDNLADSLEENLDMREIGISAYRSPLPAKIYLSGNYKIVTNLYGGVVLFSEIFRGRWMRGATVNVNKDFGRKVSTSISYTASNRSYNQLGAGLSIKFLPFQFYLVSDNALGAGFSLLTNKELNNYINSSKALSFRAGINLSFGYRRSPDKQPTSDL